MSEVSYPDIEIYLHNTAPTDIIDWLGNKFVSVSSHGTARGALSVEVATDQGTLQVKIIPGVTGKFTGICFDAGPLPWATDRDCALEAFSHFQVEVRCCAKPWEPGQAEDEWLSIGPGGESLISWK